MVVRAPGRPATKPGPARVTDNSLSIPTAHALGRHGPGVRLENRTKPAQAHQHVHKPHGGAGTPPLSLHHQLASKHAGKRRAVTQQPDTGRETLHRWTRHRTTETQRCPRDAAAGPLLTLSLSLPGGPGPRAPGAGGDDTRGLHPLRTGPGPEVGARIPATAARWCTRQASFRTKPDTQDSAPWKHHRSRWGLGRREPPLESHRFSETTCRHHTKGCSSLRKAAGQNRQARGACFRSVKSGAREKESVTLPELPPSVSTCPSTKERGPSAWGPSFTYTLAR